MVPSRCAGASYGVGNLRAGDASRRRQSSHSHHHRSIRRRAHSFHIVRSHSSPSSSPRSPPPRASRARESVRSAPDSQSGYRSRDTEIRMCAIERDATDEWSRPISRTVDDAKRTKKIPPHRRVVHGSSRASPRHAPHLTVSPGARLDRATASGGGRAHRARRDLRGGSLREHLLRASREVECGVSRRTRGRTGTSVRRGVSRAHERLRSIDRSNAIHHHHPSPTAKVRSSDRPIVRSSIVESRGRERECVCVM